MSHRSAFSPSSGVDRFRLDSKEASSQAGQGNQRLAVERMRMKRFSSALCLADVQQQQQQQQEAEDQQQVASHQRKNLAAMDASRPSLQQQQQCKSSAKSAAKAKPAAPTDKLQLAPDDPMILARQRRPSVSKGSVNVDQQGECRQPARLSAIKFRWPSRWAYGDRRSLKPIAGPNMGGFAS